MPNYKSIADLRGKKIGVSSPGSFSEWSGHVLARKKGWGENGVTTIAIGAGAGAIAALQSGQIAALANLDPVITKLERSGEIRVVSDTRTLADTRSVFGGDMPAGCLYASQSFITKNPNTTQALTNAMVRALKWLQTASGKELIATVPEGYLLGDRALYLDSWQHVKEAMSPDGLMPEDGPATSLKTLQAFDETVKGKPIDVSKTWTNDFVKKALATVKA
jgi:NitT/TauT family transport system substrate-binding protein